MKILDLWDFPVTLYCNAHEKKCITIHVLLGNIRRRFRYRKMKILWSFQRARPLDLHQDSAMELLGGGLVAPPSTQMYCAMTDGHCMLCLRHDKRPRPRGKKYDWGGGGLHQSGFLPISFIPIHATADNILLFAILAQANG